MVKLFSLLQEQQYAEWLASCRLAAKGKTLADSSYQAEVNSIKAFLSMQAPASTPAINPNTVDIMADEYVAPRFAKKTKSKVTFVFSITNKESNFYSYVRKI